MMEIPGTLPENNFLVQLTGWFTLSELDEMLKGKEVKEILIQNPDYMEQTEE